MPSDGTTAFISYSREDSEFVLRMARDLKAAGANVWLDQLDIAPGQRWARALQDAITNSPRFLVILSPASVKSTNVEDEVSFVSPSLTTYSLPSGVGGLFLLQLVRCVSEEVFAGVAVG